MKVQATVEMKKEEVKTSTEEVVKKEEDEEVKSGGEDVKKQEEVVVKTPAEEVLKKQQEVVEGHHEAEKHFEKVLKSQKEKAEVRTKKSYYKN